MGDYDQEMRQRLGAQYKTGLKKNFLQHLDKKELYSYGWQKFPNGNLQCDVHQACNPNAFYDLQIMLQKIFDLYPRRTLIKGDACKQKEMPVNITTL